VFELKTLKTALIAAAFTVVGTVASATTLSFYNDVDPNDTLRFTVDCSSCSAWDGSGWGTDGDLFDNPGGAQDETDWVNGITGGGFPKTVDSGDPGDVFVSSAEYILVKVGVQPNVGLIWNQGGEQTFTFTQVGQGAGLSHITEFGRSTVIPLPAAGFLLLGALGGMGFVARRRK
jgi:hypothetical protein